VFKAGDRVKRKSEQMTRGAWHKIKDKNIICEVVSVYGREMKIRCGRKTLNVAVSFMTKLGKFDEHKQRLLVPISKKSR
jgi:hypothetical protein